MTGEHTNSCWLCGCEDLKRIRVSNFHEALAPENFRITDSHYGVTGDIYQCERCRFRFCPGVEDSIDFYSEMEDDQYEETRSERGLQARKLIQLVAKHQSRGKLLDIGAGSGILVEEALAAGYEAVGIEPSRSLAGIAENHGLPVRLGTLPIEELKDRCDVVTLVDVIEHVDDPVALMQASVDHMNREAICILVTPDVKSLFARLLGYKWWHYRLAHIGYFDTETLKRLVATVGLEVVSIKRPSWYFPASYLLRRLYRYLPKFLHFPIPGFLDRVTIPLNLFDSLLFVCRKKSAPSQ